MIADFSIPLERTVLEFRGADTVRFLNGQLSNDIRKLQPSEAMHACVMTAKGRMNAEVWLTKLPDCIRLDGPPDMGESLLARFERYVISDDVTISDVTSDLHLLHTSEPTSAIRSRRFGLDGYDQWQTEKITIDPTHFTPAQIESFRIERGIPDWGTELDENTIPVEAGLDRDSIDYHKGCYIGQEIISRLKSVGHVNRQLIRLRTDKSIALKKGDPLYADGQSIGQITSAAASLDLENFVALAYVKRQYATPGTVLQTAASNGAILTTLALQP